MPTVDTFMTNFEGSGVVKVEPKRFLEAAAQAVSSIPSISPIAIEPPIALPEQQIEQPQLKVGPALDAEVRDRLVDLLFVRGIKFHTFTTITAYKGPEGSIILQAETGTLHFRGPLSSPPAAKKAVWSGMAERILVYPSGDLHITNQRGVYGSIRDNASTHVYVALEYNGTLVLRSLDKDESGNWRSLTGELNLEAEKTYMSPHEIRIEMCPIYGVRQVENYSKPTSLYLARVMHENVVSTTNTPNAGMCRVDTIDPTDNSPHHYFIATN